MVENFVEKYQPILTQIAISSTLQAILFTAEQKQALEHYDFQRFGALHQTILLDDGMPELIRKVE